MSDTSVSIFYFPLNSTNIIFWTIHKIWWTCLLPSRSCCNNQHFMHIMTRNTLFIWHPPNSIYGFFWWSLRCCFFVRMKFAHTEITIIAAITLQWRRWQQQQSCLIGIGRILGFFVLAFFWLLGCSIYNFTEIFVAWSSTRLATAAAENRAKFISFHVLALGCQTNLK